ncbi:MAG: cupin domain-containing protein [Planctomycetota bacterium]|jgi:mannose-6-phosphate isomerase-like protein (cupin superfamily)
MNSVQVRATFVIIVSALFAGSLFIQGCAMDNKVSGVSSGKVLVMDLSKNPEFQQLLVGAPQTCGMRSGRVYLQPGESCGQHSTKAHEELLVFLSGKGVILIGHEEIPYEVTTGEVCYIPPHTMHNNKNTGTEPLVYIFCVAPVNSPD